MPTFQLFKSAHTSALTTAHLGEYIILTIVEAGTVMDYQAQRRFDSLQLSTLIISSLRGNLFCSKLIDEVENM